MSVYIRMCVCVHTYIHSYTHSDEDGGEEIDGYDLGGHSLSSTHSSLEDQQRQRLIKRRIILQVSERGLLCGKRDLVQCQKRPSTVSKET